MFGAFRVDSFAHRCSIPFVAPLPDLVAQQKVHIGWLRGVIVERNIQAIASMEQDGGSRRLWQILLAFGQPMVEVASN